MVQHSISFRINEISLKNSEGGAHGTSDTCAFLIFTCTATPSLLRIMSSCILNTLVCRMKAHKQSCKLLYSLTCIGNVSSCTGGLQLMSRSEGWHTDTYLLKTSKRNILKYGLLCFYKCLTCIINVSFNLMLCLLLYTDFLVLILS